MKINEISERMLVDFLRRDSDTVQLTMLDAVSSAAKAYISSHTGLPLDSEDPAAPTINSYDDLTIAYMVLCQDMYDNRTMYPDAKYANSGNRTVEAIMALHGGNLL